MNLFAGLGAKEPDQLEQLLKALRERITVVAEDEWSEFSRQVGNLKASRYCSSWQGTAMRPSHPYRRAGQLQTVLPDFKLAAADLSGYFPIRKNTPARVRTFIDLL